MKKSFILIFFILNSFPCVADFTQVSGGAAYAYSFMADANSSCMITGLATAGIWRSLDGGNNWEAINSWIFFEPYISHPYLAGKDILFVDAEADTIILSTVQYINSPFTNGSQSFISIDRGDSWNLIESDFMTAGGSNDPEFMIFNEQDHHLLYYVNNYYFAWSDDFGTTWYPSVIDSIYYEKRGLYHIDSTLFYNSSYWWTETSGGYGGLCRSNDNGQSWDHQIDFYGDFGLEYAVVNGFIELSNGEWIITISWTAPEMWEERNLLLSADQGQNWERIGEDLPPRYQPDKIVEDPFLPGRLFIIGDQKYGVYSSDDYGRNWSICHNGLPENLAICGDLEVNRFNGEIYVTVNGWGVFKTCDHGESWEQVPMPPVGCNGYLSVFENTVFCRDYGYRNWRLDLPSSNSLIEMEIPLSTDTLVMMRPIAYKSNDTLVSGLWKRPVNDPVDVFQMVYSYDNGLSWEISPFLDFRPEMHFNVFHNENIVRFLSTNSAHDTVYISTNLGADWSESLAPAYFTRFVQNEADVFAASTTQVYKYNEQSNSWTSLEYSGFPVCDFIGIIDGDLYSCSFEQTNSQCYRYSQGEWSCQGVIGADITESVICSEGGGHMFAAANSGTNVLLISFDYGVSWEEAACEFPYPSQTYAFFDLKYDPYRERIWASTGAGLCYINCDELSVGIEKVVFHPVAAGELTAYPNPFNPSTTLTYSLPSPADVVLAVYDVSGRHVATLAEGFMQSGSHTAVFDGQNLSSGIYFATLQAGSFTQTQKLILLK